MSVVIFLGLAALLALCDYKHRAVPRALPILGIVLASVFVNAPILGLIAGSLVGSAVAIMADLPLGDVMVATMLGTWLGVESILLVWVLALLMGNIIWAMHEDRLINWPGEWPFTPLLLVPACVIVVAQGGW